LIGAWDLVIAHPPCTFLANSGVHWLIRDRTGERYNDLVAAALFFRKCLRANAPKVCVENPIPHGLAKKLIGETYSQIIHPWWFGHCDPKPTCLWLKGLQPLTATKVVPRRKSPNPYDPPKSPLGKGRLRAITFTGIAQAMAEQWG
jgi:hypothetical protein